MMTTNALHNSSLEKGIGSGLLALMALTGHNVPISSDAGEGIDSAYYSPNHEYINSAKSIVFEDAFFVQEHSSSEDVLLHEEKAPSSLNNQDTSGLINLFLNNYGFSKKLLSETLGITRPTLYSWLKGGSISDDNHDRLHAASELVAKIEVRHQAHLPSLLRMFAPGKGGLKFNDLFVEAINTRQTYKFILSYAEVKDRLDRKLRIGTHLNEEKSSERAMNQASSMV